MQIANIAGPAFGGFAFGFLGAVTSSGLVCLFLIGAILAMFLIHKEIPVSEIVGGMPRLKTNCYLA